MTTTTVTAQEVGPADFAVLLRRNGRTRTVPIPGNRDARACVVAAMAATGTTLGAVVAVRRRPTCDYCDKPAVRYVRDSGEGTPLCMACAVDHYGNATRAHAATNDLRPNRFIELRPEEWMMLATTVMCMTCGYSPDAETGRGMVVHGENLPTTRAQVTELGHTDTAHMPNWVVGEPGWTLADVGGLRVGDELASGETVHAVITPDEDEETCSDTEDGQVSVITDKRTAKIGWPGQGGSRIVRRTRAGEEDD